MPTTLKRFIITTLLATAFYSLLGFLILPAIALHVANQQLAEHATVPAHLERIEFNPFTLELSLFDLHIGQPDEPQLAFERLYLDLEWNSLWQGVLHLAAVELQGARTEVLFAKDGTLNLSRLFEWPQSPTQEPDSDAGLFPVRIDRLQVARGYLHLADQRPSEAIDLLYDELDFELHDLSTLPDGNAQATLTAHGPSGGRIDWRGQLSLAPLGSSGHLQLTDLALKDFWPYVRDAFPLALQEGRLSLSSDYRLDLSAGTLLHLDNTALELSPLGIDDINGRPLLRLQRLAISDSSLDLAAQRVVIGRLRSEKLETWAAREADGELNWQKLFSQGQREAVDKATPGEAQTPSASSAAKTAADDDRPAAAPWQVLLGDGQLRGYLIHLSDHQPSQDVAIDLGPLDLDLKDFDSLGTSPFSLALQTGVGKQGKLRAEGQMQLTPTRGTLKVTSEDIDLRIAQAYLSPFVHLELRSGLLASDLAVDLKGTAPLAFNVTGRAEVTQLHTLDTLKKHDLAKWQRLQLEGLDYRHDERFDIARVNLTKPYARFIINQDLTTNISDLLVAKPDAANAAPDKPLGIHIGEVNIADGSAHFADFSLRPNFATAIQQLNGHIGTLDSLRSKPARVDITGKVDRYAPVSIKGSLDPFDPLKSLDIATRFKHVELTTLTPYSGKFAGYRIRKGRLNLDLHYRIQQGQLNAENKVLVEQLQLGEKVDSPDAVDLPVRLAVALLKDTQGRISIELPVSGDLNDPQFSVMPIIWKTLRNLVLRAAQAPFKFIGGLVGGSQVDLSQVSFAPGQSELDGPARETLDTLAAALKERPVLHLQVEGMGAAASDGPLLAEQRLEQEYQETLYRILQRRGDKVPADPSSLTVAEDDKAALLEGVYRSRLKRQPPAQWQELSKDDRSARLRQAVIDSWAQSPALLRRLSQERAAAIKAYLVDQGGLADERIYLLDTGLGEPDSEGRVATVLHLDSE